MQRFKTGSSVSDRPVLYPIDPEIIVFDYMYIAKDPVVYKIQEILAPEMDQVLQIINLSTNNTEFVLEEKVFSLKQRLLNENHDVVSTIKKQFFKLPFRPGKQLVYYGTSDKLCFMLEPLPTFFKTKVVIKVNGISNDIVIKGKWLNKEAIICLNDIKEGGLPLAIVSRSRSSFMGFGKEEYMQELFEKQNYYVSIAPGVDCAFIVLLCIALDQVTGANQ